MPSGQWAVLLCQYADAGGRERDRRQPGVLHLNEGIGKVMRFGAYGEDVLLAIAGCAMC